MYRLSAFYFARSASDLPFEVTPSIFIFIIYFMVGVSSDSGSLWPRTLPLAPCSILDRRLIAAIVALHSRMCPRYLVLEGTGVSSAGSLTERPLHAGRPAADTWSLFLQLVCLCAGDPGGPELWAAHWSDSHERQDGSDGHGCDHAHNDAGCAHHVPWRLCCHVRPLWIRCE